jgi:hypothetical protein
LGSNPKGYVHRIIAAGVLSNSRSLKKTREPSDLYRVNSAVNDLKPFPYLAFPHSTNPKIAAKWPRFDGELMASFSKISRTCESISEIAIFQQLQARYTQN